MWNRGGVSITQCANENEDTDSETKCHRRWLASLCVVSIGVILGVTVAIHIFMENATKANSDISDTGNPSSIHNVSHSSEYRWVSSPNIFVLNTLCDYVLDKQLPYNVGLDFSHFENVDGEITDCKLFSNVEEYVGFSSNSVILRKKAIILPEHFQTFVPGLLGDVLNGNFSMFFEKYGTHYTSQVVLGAKIIMEIRFSKDVLLSREKILHATKRFFVESITSEDNLKAQQKLIAQFLEKSNVSFSAFGGFWKSIDQYAKWKESVLDFQTPYNFIIYSPLYDLFHSDLLMVQTLKQMFSKYQSVI